jgi:alcohol dehydrogenase, propanol-preferring
MKAMLLRETAPVGSSPLVMTDVPIPQPAAGEMRVKVHCCAVCRTDLHVVEGDLPRRKMPVIPGHQIVGHVEALGPGCRRFALGMRVGIAWLRWTCGQCRFCRAGRENLCERACFTGYHADGGYAEYAVVHEDFAYDVPPAASDIEAAPLLCAGIIGYRALKRAQVPLGGKLAMIGFGSSAHVLNEIARHRHCEVYVATRDEQHRQLAREMGATWVGSRPEEFPVKVDSAIIFAPAGELVPPTLEKLGKGGTLALAGIYMTPVPALDYERHLFYERDVHSVTSSTREDGRELLLEAAAIPIRPHVTTYPLGEANRALQDLKADRISGSGVLVVEGTSGE